MGTLIRAAVGLWLALLLMEQAPQWQGYSRLSQVQREITAANPADRLNHHVREQLFQLKRNFLAQIGTETDPKSVEIQAHALQSGL